MQNYLRIDNDMKHFPKMFVVVIKSLPKCDTANIIRNCVVKIGLQVNIYLKIELIV